MQVATDHIQSLVVIVGLSGAGKSVALNTFEDSGFYALDNLPVSLLAQFLNLTKTAPAKYSKIALHLDIDTHDKLLFFTTIIDEIDKSREKLKVVFLDAKTETLIKRYSETRRPHPGFDAAKDKSLEETIIRERRRLSRLREITNLIIDTSELSVHDLKRELSNFINSLPHSSGRQLRVNFLSFGFKFGVPIDCDLVIDVRFLPNPFFIENLKDKTGLEAEVSEYVLNFPEAQEFIKKYSELLEFLLPKYQYEGKSYLNIGVGCTGGKHRSVALAERLSKAVSANSCLISVKHRDI